MNSQIEREAYEVTVEGGKLVYKQSKNLVHTIEGSKWIFVLSSSRVLYVGQKEKGKFQHSSFVAGAATIASGRIVAHNGVLHVCMLHFSYTYSFFSMILNPGFKPYDRCGRNSGRNYGCGPLYRTMIVTDFISGYMAL